MQKYFEIASIRVQLSKYYHVAYNNIISVTVCVSVNNNKRKYIHLIMYYRTICYYPQMPKEIYTN